nr:energy transducer TonB [uncultured Pseudomonas sp.]
MKPALQLPELGLSFAPATAELPEPRVRCRFNVHSGDETVRTAAIAFPVATLHLRLLSPLRTPPSRSVSPNSARLALVLVPLVVAVHLLALWLSNAQSVPETVEPAKQTVVIHTGLAADPAIAAAAQARADAQAAEAQRQQAAEQAQAAKQQAQLEASHLAEQAQIQAREKAAARPPVKPAPQHRATTPAQTPPAAPPSLNTAPSAAAATAQPVQSAAKSGAPTDVPASAGKQYVPLVKTAPDYPAAALENELEGDCTVEYDLLPNGTTMAPRLVKGLCDASNFGTASLKAAAGFRYSPQEADGHPVKVIGVRNTFHYRLQNAQ